METCRVQESRTSEAFEVAATTTNPAPTPIPDNQNYFLRDYFDFKHVTKNIQKHTYFALHRYCNVE